MMNILIVDDHSIVREGLRSRIQLTYPDANVQEASSVKDALKSMAAIKYDGVLLDYQLQDGNAMDVIHALEAFEYRPRIIILTAFEDDRIIYQCVQSGVEGILLKTSDPRRILEAIQAVYTGSTYYDDAILHKMVCYVKRKDEIQRILNENECRILRHLSSGFSNQEIADQMFMSEKTIRNYLSVIYEKIGVKNRTEAVLYYQRHVK